MNFCGNLFSRDLEKIHKIRESKCSQNFRKKNCISYFAKFAKISSSKIISKSAHRDIREFMFSLSLLLLLVEMQICGTTLSLCLIKTFFQGNYFIKMNHSRHGLLKGQLLKSFKLKSIWPVFPREPPKRIVGERGLPKSNNPF